MNEHSITTLFLDIGGVLLSNGWGNEARSKTIAHFNLDGNEVNERHHLTLDTYEEGKLTLGEYLKRVVFYEKRNFSEDEFIAFMLNQSFHYHETIDHFKKLKEHYKLRMIAVSNEGRELFTYRVNEFKLNELFDVFVYSSFVHFRKPDRDIFLIWRSTSLKLIRSIPFTLTTGSGL